VDVVVWVDDVEVGFGGGGWCCECGHGGSPWSRD
jgi:hypothetical protein